MCYLKDRVGTEVLLQTVLCVVEGLMNSKPLGYAWSNVADVDPITPNMLLMGRRDSALPPVAFSQGEELGSRKQWRHVQLIVDSFWKKFVSEYLPSQQIRRKWTKETENLRKGDQVLVIDNHAQRGEWSVGEIVDAHPGVILRDSHGFAQVRWVTGNKILRVLKTKGLSHNIPDDLYHMIKRGVAARKHLERNRKDRDAKFRLILESRIHRLARYYKRKRVLPPNWKYESDTASAMVA
ncbi:PREDICTED: 40S ribosomal protein S13-like isoform X1 [Priapulus caudatus]|uniref:40S ribosomal protein S13-like isoform X1 n=1 Tax=Priapulus caudatus TaxID=37621 RepID=A0ABM1E484_PRICU|nr:PREDICTED: 40S ribosomal protein S13-like isoform X1 [Priapulus caudatus]